MTLFDIEHFSAERHSPAEAASPAGMQAPLAARMRPSNFDEFVGQEHLVGSGRVLRKCIDADQIPSMILWGPPGSGKTTLANVIASVTKSHFTRISAVSAGVADLRQAIEEAAKRLKRSGQRSILFIDEIQYFSATEMGALIKTMHRMVILLLHRRRG